MSEVHLYHGDLPSHVRFTGAVAIDTEAMGLNNYRDRLCLVQLAGDDGVAHIVKFSGREFSAPNLVKLLADGSIQKVFHFARFDMAILRYYLDVMPNNVYCTKIASRLARTYTDEHGLRALCQELLHIKISKQEQASDWGKPELSDSQLNYAATDVLHLIKIKELLHAMVVREGRESLLRGCLEFLPTRIELDLAGWATPAKIFDY